MKFLKNVFIPVLLLNISAHAADKGGNGGGGHVCPGEVEVYDLYEGRVRFDLNTTRNSIMNQDETIKWGVDKVSLKDPTLAALINLEINVVKSKMKLREIEIGRTLDADNIYADPGCQYEQIANWDVGIDKIVVNNRIWKNMDPFQRGVLIFHEAAYSIYRRHGQNLSSVENTRRFVSQVFSDSDIKEQLIILKGGFSSPSPWEPIYVDNYALGTPSGNMSVYGYKRTHDLSFRNITCSSKRLVFEMSLSKEFMSYDPSRLTNNERKIFDNLKQGFKVSFVHSSKASEGVTEGILKFAKNNKLTLETDLELAQDSKLSRFSFHFSQMGNVQNSWFIPYPYSLNFSLVNLKVTRPECNETYEIELGGKAVKYTNKTANIFREFIFITHP